MIKSFLKYIFLYIIDTIINLDTENKELFNMTEDEKHRHLKRSHDMQVQLEELSKAISMKVNN